MSLLRPVRLYDPTVDELLLEIKQRREQDKRQTKLTDGPPRRKLR